MDSKLADIGPFGLCLAQGAQVETRLEGYDNKSFGVCQPKANRAIPRKCTGPGVRGLRKPQGPYWNVVVVRHYIYMCSCLRLHPGVDPAPHVRRGRVSPTLDFARLHRPRSFGAAKRCSLGVRTETRTGAPVPLDHMIIKELFPAVREYGFFRGRVSPPHVDLAVTSGALTSRTFDLLLDVELPVSVSFGRAQVQLKDVFKLTTGSIIELNRSIAEPVEVIVNNCVIARGEVVVVEGNFGVRIQQVISRQERLRTLH